MLTLSRNALSKAASLFTWLAIAVATAACFLNVLQMPLLGDDARYAWSWQNFGPVKAMAAIYFNCNARFGDITNYFWLYALPRSVTAAMCAGMVILLFVAFFRLCSLSHRPALRALATAAIFTICPWSDSLEFIVLHVNYIWAIALASTTLWLILKTPMLSAWWLLYIPVAGISGFGHEIVGIPALLGVVAWLSMRNKSDAPLSTPRKYNIAALMAGGLISVSSPGSYLRLTTGQGGTPDDAPLALILLLSAGIGLVLAIDIVILRFNRREELRRLCHTIWLPLTVIALSSMAFVIVSHKGGRTGWCTQYFGLAALFSQLSAKRLPNLLRHWSLKYAVACALGIFFTAQWCGVMYYDRELAREHTRMLDEYMEHPDRPVSPSCYSEPSDLPAWLMGKVPSNAFTQPDSWPRDVLTIIYGKPMLLSAQSTAKPNLIPVRQKVIHR